MVNASEDEQEEDVKAILKDTYKDDQSQRKSRSDRAVALRKMMDDEGTWGSIILLWLHLLTYGDEPGENASEPSAPAADHSQPSDALRRQNAVPEPLAVVSCGRRRGRRTVMKKKTIKDDEGYLGKPIIHPLHAIFTSS